MKFKFKKQPFQTDSVNAVADCFVGQPKIEGVTYRIDPGKQKSSGPVQQNMYQTDSGFKNRELVLTKDQLLANIHAVQQRQNLPQSPALVSSKVCAVNLDIEMETGTGKTYCYIKTMFELNRRFGWSKYIVVVPSIAIREGIFKSLEITAEHFMEEFKKRARFFIYSSKNLSPLEQFSSDGGINVMVINVQAFNATGKDARRIYEELDDFQSRRPIDVISSNHPIMILDEPQKLEGAKTFESLAKFKPLAILRYSATHKTEHNKVYRLDALDAYNQKLVKKIAVRGITVRGLTGTNAYLYLESIQISTNSPPVARIEYEVKQQSGIKRTVRKFGKNDNLFDLSGGLAQYKGFVVADISAITDTVTFTNGVVLEAGEATGDVNEATLRRIQIRETIKAHLDKEQALFHQGIKVLSLFFIDEVAKYRRYDGDVEHAGEYARIFEEEYHDALNDLPLLHDEAYRAFLNGIKAERTHNGYFSIDKKTNRLVEPETKQVKDTETGRKVTVSDDVDAYDIILKGRRDLAVLSAEKENHEKFLRESTASHAETIKKHEALICEKIEHASKLETLVSDYQNKIDTLEVKIKGLLSEIKVIENSISVKRNEAGSLDVSVRTMKVEEMRLVNSISDKREIEAKLLASNEEAKKEFARLSSEAKLLADRAK